MADLTKGKRRHWSCMLECLYSRVYFVVVYCTNPPGIVPEKCTTTLLSFNALEKFAYKEKISYACEAGRKFTDGTKKRDVICTGDGTWNFNEVDCDCKLYKFLDCFIQTRVEYTLSPI